MKVAIIGMGTAGVSTLNQLSKHKQFKNITVDIYDNREDMGMGKPFQNDSEKLLINLPANQMTLNPNDEKDFKKWYKQNDTFDYGKSKYLPRFVFGHYMKSILNELVNKNDNIFMHNHKVESCYVIEKENKWGNKPFEICYKEGESAHKKQYDYVFITIGVLPYKDPFELSGLQGYISSPYPTTQSLRDVNEKDDIVIVGTGLSAIDVIRYVMDNHQKFPIVVTSRNAQFPTVRGTRHHIEMKYINAEQVEVLKKKNDGFLTLEDVDDLFEKECEHQNINFKKLLYRFKRDNVYNMKYDMRHEDEVGQFQAFMTEFKHQIVPIWNALTLEDKSQFISKYGHHIKRNTNPMPQSTAKQLIEWIENGDLIVKEGLENVRKYYGKFRLKFENEDIEDRYHYVINASGPKTQLNELENGEHFIKDLENKQIVAPHPFGGILVKPYSNEVISPKYGTLNNIKVIGQLTSGVHFDMNGVSLLVEQTVHASTAFYENFTVQKENKKHKKSKKNKKTKKNKSKKK
ncbi:FAD/NAD(P)-binding protein [Mammaliicoccus sp. Dog046]|uniref:FAD/NAD(P)-binding protein n=1 Tax=Mammaliicoccus sp. Dog046 TaxID=3034233 RepID=UPI002B25D106|nr:FAD/NAD(P)-binding protein [Mammaliicoccus sp. Dog046]WQK86381.1 FAD/NAD(P)-binding protein [Mammaliicoccus sp. Dog046]